MSQRLGAVACATVVAGGGLVIAPAAMAYQEMGVDGNPFDDVIISEPFFAAPDVLSPTPGNSPLVVEGAEGEWWWILEVTNSDFQPDFVADEGFIGFETMPSVGIFDSVADRLAWTNQTFACFVGTSCVEPAQTADQRVFGDDFVKLPKLYNETTGRVAYHAEHAYDSAQDPYEWAVGQETLSIAIPLAMTPTGVIEVWVGYTYIYTDDLVGVPVRFTEEAMAITFTTVDIPPLPDTGGEDTDGGVRDSEGIPLWVAQAVLGMVGVVVIFGLIVLIVSRMVALIRKQE